MCPCCVYTAPTPCAPIGRKASASRPTTLRRTANRPGGIGVVPVCGTPPEIGICPVPDDQMMESTCALMMRLGNVFSAISASSPGWMLRNSFWEYIARIHCSFSTKDITGTIGNCAA
ncbi:hypothetical protein D3C78_1585910 [compost metagenome]